jgi:hypothetical protein
MNDATDGRSPDTDRKMLSHPTRGAMPSWGGGVVFAVGAVATTAAVVLLLLGLAALPAPLRVPEAARPMLLVLSGMAGVLGVPALASGVKLVLLGKPRMRANQDIPDGPWIDDYPWDPSGASDDSRSGVAATAIAAVFVAGFGLVFILARPLVGEGGPGGVVKLVFGIVGWAMVGVGLVLVGRAAYLLARHLRYGRSRLRFEGFPFRLGLPLRATLEPGRTVLHYERITCTLRCIQEEFETRGRGEQRRVVNLCYQIWADALELEGPGELIAGGSGLPVTFQLPDRPDLATSLSQSPPRYWELEVQAKTRGVDYRARFLAPVYA